MVNMKPQNRPIKKGDDTRNAGGQTVIDIQSTRRFNVDVKNRPGPVPVNRFTQIGITDVNALSCKDVRLGKSRVPMGSLFGGYRANVAQKAQERYQSSSKNLSYKPGTPLIVGSDN